VGAVGQYNDLAHPPPAPYNLFDIVGKQLRVEGYLVKDHVDQRDDYEAFMVPLVQSGRVPVEESVTLRFEHAIEACGPSSQAVLRQAARTSRRGSLLVICGSTTSTARPSYK
jgi:hypothetical protein